MLFSPVLLWLKIAKDVRGREESGLLYSHLLFVSLSTSMLLSATTNLLQWAISTSNPQPLQSSFACASLALGFWTVSPSSEVTASWLTVCFVVFVATSSVGCSSYVFSSILIGRREWEEGTWSVAVNYTSSLPVFLWQTRLELEQNIDNDYLPQHPRRNYRAGKRRCYRSAVGLMLEVTRSPWILLPSRVGEYDVRQSWCSWFIDCNTQDLLVGSRQWQLVGWPPSFRPSSCWRELLRNQGEEIIQEGK